MKLSFTIPLPSQGTGGTGAGTSPAWEGAVLDMLSQPVCLGDLGPAVDLHVPSGYRQQEITMYNMSLLQEQLASSKHLIRQIFGLIQQSNSYVIRPQARYVYNP